MYTYNLCFGKVSTCTCMKYSLKIASKICVNLIRGKIQLILLCKDLVDLFYSEINLPWTPQ